MMWFAVAASVEDDKYAENVSEGARLRAGGEQFATVMNGCVGYVANRSIVYWFTLIQWLAQ
jgi:hypothetical protein